MRLPTGSTDEARAAVRDLDVQIRAAWERADQRRARLEEMIRDVWRDMDREIEPLQHRRRAIVNALVNLSVLMPPAPVIIMKEEG